MSFRVCACFLDPTWAPGRLSNGTETGEFHRSQEGCRHSHVSVSNTACLLCAWRTSLGVSQLGRRLLLPAGPEIHDLSHATAVSRLALRVHESCGFSPLQGVRSRRSACGRQPGPRALRGQREGRVWSLAGLHERLQHRQPRRCWGLVSVHVFLRDACWGRRVQLPYKTLWHHSN